MKMQKLDPKQVPQVIALGVVSVGVFGYAVFTFAGSGPKPDTAAAATKKDAASTSTASTSGSTTTGTTTAETKMALSVAEAGTDPTQSGAATPNGAPGINLPGQYNPDPFKSAAKPEVAPKAVEVTPKPAPVKTQIKAPSLPDASGKGGLTPPVTLVTPPPVPAGPERPEVRVTGTSVVDGLNLAIVEIGPEHRVVQVGDVVSKGYRVKKIQLQGVVFAKEKDHFFQGVGAKSDPNKPDNAEGKPTQL